MADKLIIVVANIELSHADQLLTPLSQAATAVAMEYEVEVIFSGLASQLASKKFAQSIYTRGSDIQTALQLIQHAKSAGVIFKVCMSTIDTPNHDLLAEIDETVGSAYVITEAMDDSVVTFTY